MSELEIQLERVDQREKSNSHQIESLREEIRELKKDNKAIYDIACSVKVMAEKLGNIEEKVDETAERLKNTESKISQIESLPAEKTSGNLEKIKIAVITAICTGVAVSIANAVLKLTFGG